jgi:phosphate-selective porin OprO and OprP
MKFNHLTLAMALSISSAESLYAAEATTTQQSTEAALLARLEALENRIIALERHNTNLKEQLEQADSRVERVEVRSAKASQPGPAPTYADVNDTFTFKARGTLQADFALYHERAGGYDYSSGTDVRRARFGFDGTAYRNFRWRVEGEYLKNTANLLDLYVQYTFSPFWSATVGQHKAPFGLEANSADGFNTFLERGMAGNAFGAVGAERRVGASFTYQTDAINGAFGVFGTSEAVVRNATTPDEGYGVNARLSWAPILNPGDILHLGVSSYYATDFAANSLTLSERPNVRIDDGRLVSAAIPGTAPLGGLETGAKSATFLGAESAWVHGAFSLQSEYGHLSVDRFGSASSLDFDGGYIFGSYFLTGETRSIRNGVAERIRPFSNFDLSRDGWGAWELALRYDTLDLTDLGLSPLKRRARSVTAAANWYLNPNTKLVFNYIRFAGTNSPLVALPVQVNGTKAEGDAFGARLQFDF